MQRKTNKIYIYLITKLQQLYKEYKYTTVIVTVAALGAIPETLEENLKKLINEERIPIVIQRIQKAALLGTVKVCKTILKMPWRDKWDSKSERTLTIIYLENFIVGTTISLKARGYSE